MLEYRIQRINKLYKKVIANILEFRIRDKRLKWVTITDVNVSSDLSVAKVYFTIFGENDTKTVLQGLDKAKNFIKREVAKRVSTRNIPELYFCFDETEEKARKLDYILRDIDAPDVNAKKP